MEKPTIALTGRRQVGKSHVAQHLVDKHDFIRMHPFNPGKAGCRAMYVALGVTPGQAVRMTDTDLKDVSMGVFPLRDEPIVNFDYNKMARAFVMGYLDYLDVEPDMIERMVYGSESEKTHRNIPQGTKVKDFINKIEEYMREHLWDPPKEGEIRSPKTKLMDSHPEGMPGHYTSRHVMERLGQFLGVTMGPEWTILAEIERANRIYGSDKGKVIESIVYEAGNIRHFPGLFIVRVTADNEKPIESPESDAVVQSIKEDASFHNEMLGMEEMGKSFDDAMEKQGVSYVASDRLDI